MSFAMIKSPAARPAALALFATLSLSLALAGCGKRDEAAPPAAPAGAPAAAPATATGSAPAAAAQDPQQKLANAKALASSTASDAKLESVLTGGSNWRSTKQGAAANDEFVGFELPEGAALQPGALVVRWVAWHWVPRTLAIEYSDDGKAWKTAASLPVKEPSDVPSRMQGLNRWDEAFDVPASAGAHRFWRVRAADMPEGNFFGLERLSVR